MSRMEWRFPKPLNSSDGTGCSVNYTCIINSCREHHTLGQMDLSSLRRQIDSLLALESQLGRGNDTALASQLLNGTLSVMTAVYGSESHQVRALSDLGQEIRRKSDRPAHLEHNSSSIIQASVGALRNLKEELDSGFAGSLQKRLTSEVLTDLVQLARAVLEEPGDSAKNVAAVLAAAAFEDTIRRMGTTFAGVIGKDDLTNVIDALKTKGILMAPQLGIASGYLNFRNRALHANWDQIDRASVNSILGFVEGLLMKHFQ